MKTGGLQSMILCLLLLFGLHYPPETVQPYSQNNPFDRPIFRISVVVSCRDESLKNEITSFVSRELHALRDVVVTDENPRYTIRVVAFENRDLAGRKTGVTLSVLTVEAINQDAIEGFVIGLLREARASKALT